jgi:hypothetical protein
MLATVYGRFFPPGVPTPLQVSYVINRNTVYLEAIFPLYNGRYFDGFPFIYFTSIHCSCNATAVGKYSDKLTEHNIIFPSAYNGWSN